MAGVAWMTDEAEVLEKARTSRSLILVDFFKAG